MINVAFLLPHFRAGGAERVVLNWIGALDRTRFRPVLLLKTIDGAFLDLLPPDVTPIALGAKRAWRLPRHIGAALARHDIHVAYSATNAMNLALLAAKTGNTARVISEHTPPAAYLAEAKLPLLRRAVMRRFYTRADAVLVPTDRIGAELSAMIARPIAVQTVPNPVVNDVARIAPRMTHTTPQLVSAGRLVAAKGYDTLLDACALLAGKRTAFHLTIHGAGPLRQFLAERIVTLGLSAHVTLAGHTDQPAQAFAAADLFVLASRREGFGNVLIEAMAVGTPVLATTSGGPETFLRDGENGFLVRAEDAIAMAQAITQLLVDPAKRDSVRNAAADSARQFAIHASTRRFEALLEAVVLNRSMAA